MKAALGGTFNVIHDGHRLLLTKAFEVADIVSIGITSDEMAHTSCERVNPYHIRKSSLEGCLKEYAGRYTVCEINDIFGSAASDASLDLLVVSEETLANGHLVNEERVRLGLKKLQIVTVKMVKGSDGKEIHSSRIMNGECSSDGRTNVIRIAVGSLNPVKVEAVRTVMKKIYGSVIIIPKDVKSSVPDQPFGEQTCEGAKNRASCAISDCDLSVGIEAGVFEMYDGLYDIQHCVVLDAGGSMTIGMGPGFRYPDDVADLIRNGMTVGQAMAKLHSDPERGRSDGAIGYLSKGLMDRKELTEQAVTAAMILRIHGSSGLK